MALGWTLRPGTALLVNNANVVYFGVDWSIEDRGGTEVVA
jgi:hypothetical protein